ncbi:MAG: cell division topological specificity factor MinE [bacterium]|jgi:cell division topological specificity factor|nr:cell division topological specificity factor MinE [Bacillota bacterium]HHW54798.1 cell division topological specificity factor MinE [Bacillota bacterium]
MLEVLSRVFGKENAASKEIAKERLRLVLVHDRATVSPRFLELIKEEIVEVIANYMEIDEERMEVSLNNMDDAVALVASIPVRKVKRVARPTG